jgi:hypothetical protein
MFSQSIYDGSRPQSIIKALSIYDLIVIYSNCFVV